MPTPSWRWARLTISRLDHSELERRGTKSQPSDEHLEWRAGGAGMRFSSSYPPVALDPAVEWSRSTAINGRVTIPRLLGIAGFLNNLGGTTLEMRVAFRSCGRHLVR